MASSAGLLSARKWNRRLAVAVPQWVIGHGTDAPPSVAQIKVRDLSKAEVSVSPAEYGSWQEARSDLMKEAKKGLVAERAAALGAASDSEKVGIRAHFDKKEREMEHSIDHKPLKLHMALGVSYNVRAAHLLAHACAYLLTACGCVARAQFLSK